jgi:hypothetical protein
VRLYLYLGVTLALAALLSFSHIWVYRHGKQIVRAEWSESVAAANIEASRFERKRQQGVDEAEIAASKRNAGIAAAARAARGELGGLRDAVDAAHILAAQSSAAADNTIRTLGELLQRCGAEYVDVAAEADRAYSEVKTLREAWPR